mmetsp:Transcript_17320/g.23924  ORF Transcript_17320/g.23924 Transcript_17320/m.23924 type:complete len:142 (-) Transcript_17320:300-725(-)
MFLDQNAKHVLKPVTRKPEPQESEPKKTGPEPEVEEVDLPDDWEWTQSVLCDLFQYMDVNEIFTLAQVNKEWNSAAKSQQLWKRQFETHFQHNPNDEDRDWLRSYRLRHRIVRRPSKINQGMDYGDLNTQYQATYQPVNFH